MISPIQILKAVCKDFGITQTSIAGRSRAGYLVRARKEFARRMQDHNYSASDTAVYLQRRHNNILHYLKDYAKGKRTATK